MTKTDLVSIRKKLLHDMTACTVKKLYITENIQLFYFCHQVKLKGVEFVFVNYSLFFYYYLYQTK